MRSNTRLLVFLSTLFIILGFFALWYGVNPQTTVTKKPIPSTQITQASSQPLPEIPIATNSAVAGVEGEKALVTKVVDGDTIEIEGNVPVRLIGIDTPETVDPRRPVGCFGKEASNETKKLLTGKLVILQKDVSETDKYNRLLRYVYLPLEDGSTLFVNDYLVREGYAKILTYPPDVKFNEQFLEAQRQAREQNKGLWSKC